MENEKENQDWVDEFANKFAEVLTGEIQKGLLKKEQEKQPERNLSEIKKEIESKTLGELALLLSK